MSMDKKPSIRDVALRAEVALGTVSRVINGHPSVSEDTRKRVNAAIVELGYAPDIVAQSMRNHRSMTFACVMRDFTVPVLSMFVDSMQKEIDAFGFSLMVASSYHDLNRELSLLRGFQQRRIDGLVIATSSETDPALLFALNNLNFPVVLIDRDQPDKLDSVCANHSLGVLQATLHLIDLGHRQIAFITGEPGMRPTENRLDGFLQALSERSISVNPSLIRAASFSPDVGYAETCWLLDQAQPPTAIFAGGTSLLSGVLRAIKDRGLTIPEDISVVGGADSDLAMLTTPSVSVVRWNHDHLGKAAGRFLVERLADHTLKPRKLTVDSEFVNRNSTASPK